MNPLWNLTRTLLGQEEQQNVIIKVDPTWGFCEFPAPGDVKKHLLPILVDPEEVAAAEGHDNEKVELRPAKEFWMPDKYCKVCYGCEEPFTMFRRRHHCRMCGQIFCNTCSSYSLDGSLFNSQSAVRACRLCYEQALERSELETKQIRRKFLVEKSVQELQHSHQVMRDLSKEYNKNMENLQLRASAHLSAIVKRLVAASSLVTPGDRDMWIDIILSLVKGVVESVDPDVRAGDDIDIRPYVKIKVIPGGETSECGYVDGVVFRKNVSHKKMGTYGTKDNPRILLLAGGIEFQRADMKLSSMDTLIEQEDKHMELLVDKIMSLKPDIILVGKSVARKAQELLCEHQLIVMQNVKLKLLERLSRMTGAMLLPSTDTMIQQYGEECLGTCGHFKLRLVQDDPEKSTSAVPQRILRTRISRASTYAYVQGCPPERGCTIVLRGAFRATLKEIKRILRFSVLVAYHLRLEVAYYNDRFADLPALITDADYEDSSDVDDAAVDAATDVLALAEGNQKLLTYFEKNPGIRSFQERYYLSMSMDIDVLTPRHRELVGAPPIRYKPITAFNIETHQTLLITSVLMGEGPGSTPVQKNPADVKAIQFYTYRDVAVGKFLIEHCFQLHRGFARESKMLDQTQSFIHRFGRIDITIRRDRAVALATEDTAHRDPLRLPIHMESYCKQCHKIVTPKHVLSDEVWKMSFGKFLEILFYNRSARCNVGGCRHSLRDCHTLSFHTEGYQALFDFVPVHPYTLIVRNHMAFPEEFYANQGSLTLSSLPVIHMTLMDDFRTAIAVLEREIKDVLATRPGDLELAMADVRMIDAEIDISTVLFLEQLVKTMEAFLAMYPGNKEMETTLLLMLQDRLAKNRASMSQSSQLMDVYNDMITGGGSGGSGGGSGAVVALLDDGEVTGSTKSLTSTGPTGAAATTATTGPVPTATATGGTAAGGAASGFGGIEDTVVPRQASEIIGDAMDGGMSYADLSMIQRTHVNPRIAVLFPYVHYRDAYLRASRWNTRIDTIYRFLESVRNLIAQQQQAAAAALHAAGGATAVGGGISAEDIYEVDPFLVPRKTNAESVHPPLAPAVAVATVATVADDGASSAATVLVSAADDGHRDPSVATAVDGSGSAAAVASSATTIAAGVALAATVHDGHYEQPGTRDVSVVDPSSASFSLVSHASTATTTTTMTHTVAMNSTASATAFTGALAGDASLGITSLYRAVQEQNKKTAEKPNDKMSKITKALSRFLAGNKDNADEQPKFVVPLGDFGHGRYGLPPGREGIVVPVHDESHASIIAFALASTDYWDNLQASIRDDHYDQGDYDNGEEFLGASSKKTPSTVGLSSGSSLSATGATNASSSTGGVGKAAAAAGAGAGASSSVRDSAGGGGGGGANGSRQLSTIHEEHVDGDDDDAANNSSSPNGAARGSGGGGSGATPSHGGNKHNTYALSELLASQAEGDEGGAEDDAGIVPGFLTGNELNDPQLMTPPISSPTSSSVGASPAVGARRKSLNEAPGGAHSPGTGPPVRRSSATAKDAGSSSTACGSINSNSTAVGGAAGVVAPGATTTTSTTSARGTTAATASTAAASAAAAAASGAGGGGTASSPASPSSPSRKGAATSGAPPTSSTKSTTTSVADGNEKQMMSQDKSDIRIRFNDYDDRGQLLCKFSCQVYWAKQFEALRKCYFQDDSSSSYSAAAISESLDNFIRSLAMSARWSAQGGKSGASFSKTMDERMVIKVISRVELQMFLDFAPAYFEYMAKAYYQYLPTVMCKILGVYTVRYDNKETGKRMSENVVVMENIFYGRNITKTFDLKGSSRARYVELHDVKQKNINFDETTASRRRYRRKQRRLEKQRQRKAARVAASSAGAASPPSPAATKTFNYDDYEDMYGDEDGDDDDGDEHRSAAGAAPESVRIEQVLLDDNLMEFTRGRPFPMKPKAKYFFKLAVDNDTLFLSIVNVVDYSILVGFDDDRQEMVVGIIDYLRQYDIVKKMERVGKGGVGMLTGQADPTIIPPAQYRKRFSLAMERYFMTVPDKWIAYDRNQVNAPGASAVVTAGAHDGHGAASTTAAAGAGAGAGAATGAGTSASDGGKGGTAYGASGQASGNGQAVAHSAHLMSPPPPSRGFM